MNPRQQILRPNIKFEDVYYKSSNFFIRFGLVAGVFPVSKNFQGTYEFRWTSLNTFYSIFIYLFTSCAVVYSTYFKILHFSNPELPFDEYLFTLIYILSLTSHWFFQAVSLPSSKSLVEYLTTWTRFQKHFLLVTGSTINFDYRIKFITILSFGTIMSVVIPIAQTVMLGDLTLNESVGFYHTLCLYSYLCLWWSVQCRALVCAVKTLRKTMKKEFTNHPKYVDVRRYRNLWEHIHTLVEKLSSSMRWLYGVYNFFSYLSLFVSVYCAVSHLLSNRQTVCPQKLAGFIVAVVYYGSHTYVFCDSAHFLRQEITHEVVRDLVKIPLYKLSYESAREINSFLNVVNTKKVGLVVTGNLSIFRGTLTKYVSSIAMYCLVLLQFKITLPNPIIQNPEAN